MTGPKINVLVSSIAGLGLPPTLVFPLDRSANGLDLWSALTDRLSIDLTARRYILSTHANYAISQTSNDPLSSLTDTDSSDLLSLRLWAPLCGGKGGFGSQLRAAGGRMSSKKNRGQGEDNGSSRNLDGRRIRTANEAKALAEYLAVKPNMDKRQKGLRRERLEKVVEMAERRVDEIKNGGKGRLDEKWVEDKKEATARAREAVFAAMNSGSYKDNILGTSQGSQSDVQPGSSEEQDDIEEEGSSGSELPVAEAEASSSKASADKPKTFFGFDEDDEFMSSDDE